MSGMKYGGNRSRNNEFFDDYYIEAASMKLEAVRVEGIQPRNCKGRVPEAVYRSLKENYYKWDIQVHCEFTADRMIARNQISIENITLMFPKAENQIYVLVPGDKIFEWHGRRIENFRQDRPCNAVAGSMRFKFWQDLHLFKIRKQSEMGYREPNDDFWHAFRNFMGYQRVLDERYRRMDMIMRVHVHAEDVEDDFFWHSEWDADETPFEICSLSEYDNEKMRLVYTADSHWIDGRDR